MYFHLTYSGIKVNHIKYAKTLLDLYPVRVTLEPAKCPYCSKKQPQKPVKSWKYGKMIVTRTIKGTKWGHNITCSRYACKCGNLFNFYHSVKGKTWTIPKNLKNNDDSKQNI